MGVVCDLDRKPARLPLFILSCSSLCLGLDTENVTTSRVMYLMDLIKSRLSICILGGCLHSSHVLFAGTGQRQYEQKFNVTMCFLLKPLKYKRSAYICASQALFRKSEDFSHVNEGDLTSSQASSS